MNTSTIQCSNTGFGHAGEKQCSQCQSAFYCSENCQRANWKSHRPTCKRIKKEMEEKKGKEKELSEAKVRAWAQGLTPEQQREWLVDCYRMREKEYIECDGDNTPYGPRDSVFGSVYEALHAEREYDPTKDLLENFLVFCRLALAQGALPQGWDWSEFLATAAKLLPLTFDKDDAKEKYGWDEGIIQEMRQGRRSLRYTGEAIYGSGILNVGKSELHVELNREILKKRTTCAMVADVGGKELWDRLKMKLDSSLYTMTSKTFFKKSKFLSAKFKQF